MKNSLDRTMCSLKNNNTTAALEDTIAAFIGAGAAVFVNSGAAANRLALQLAAEEVYGVPISARSGMKEGMAGSGMRFAGSLRGRYVFCSDLAPASLACTILREGGKPVFIDVSPCDWCMDPEALEIAFALYPDVKIVLMTHLYGFPGQIREIKDICVRHGAVLIEDASEALGASIGGRMAGSFGDFGILDFGKGKIISGNAGGMLLLNGESSALVCAARSVRKQVNLPEPALLWVRYEETGYGYAREDFRAMAEPLAKRILYEFPRLPERIARKREIYENYRAMLDGDLMYMNPVGAETEPNYWMPCITCESAIPFQESRFEGGYSYANPHGTSSPMEIHDALRASGIWSRPVYRPLHLQPAFRGCDQVSLDGSKCGDKEGGMAICQERNKREAKNIKVAQKASDAANGLDRVKIAGIPAKDASRKILGGTVIPAISWARLDWSRQISSTGLCLPSAPDMAREEQERVAGIIYACFDAGEAGGFWKTA